MNDSSSKDTHPVTDTQAAQPKETKANLRRLALKNPIDSKLMSPPEITELCRQITTKPLPVYVAVESELISRGCALILLLVAGGGASVAFPVKLIEQLKINPDEAQRGYVRWSVAAPRNKKLGRLLGRKADKARGPRQFLYGDSQCHLLAFVRFRINRMNAKVGDVLLPPVNKDLLAAARKDLSWLKSVKGKVTWSSIFRAWMENQLQNFGFKQEKIVGTITEGSLWHLYRHEPPLLLGARRGNIIVAPLPDKQFLELLPVSSAFSVLETGKKEAFNSIDAEEFLENSDSAMMFAEKGEDNSSEDERNSASSEIRAFLRRIVDGATSYREAADEAKEMLKIDVFKPLTTKDYYYLLKWLVAKFDFGSGKRKRVTSLQTYAKRLLRLIDAFPDTPFAEITLDDMTLYLSQYSTANAAKFYRAVAANFHKYLRDKEGINVIEIDWKSPRLQFYSGYREQGVITETQFQSALECVGASSRLSPQQMRIILLLLRRLGLRCAEAAWLTLGDFDGISECRLLIEQSKTRAGKRALPVYLLLSENEQAELFDFIDERRKISRERQPDAPLFELADGSPVEAAQIGAETTKVLKAAGIEHKTAHGLRHAFATGLVAAWWLRQKEEEFDANQTDNNQESDWARQALKQFARVEVEGRAVEYADDIRLLLGHADLEITFERYVHVIDLITADAVQIAESVNPPKFLSTTVVAALAGTSVRAVTERFPSKTRLLPQTQERATTIAITEVKKWLVERLRNALKNR